METSNKEAQHDCSGEVAIRPDSDSLGRLHQLTTQMAALVLEKIKLEERLEDVSKQLRVYEENLIPELMSELDLSELRTAHGLHIEMKSEVRASLPKDPEKRAIVFSYLRDTGNEGLIKNEFRIAFGREADKSALEFQEKLIELGIDGQADVSHEYTIHHQTLLKFIREQLSDGAPIPLESFGAYIQTFAKIKKSKS